MTAHSFEPELARPTPRPIAAREGCGYGCALWGVRLFTLPHTLMGPWLAYKAVWGLIVYLGVLLAGTEVEGRVTRKTETPTKKETYYGAEYAFVVDGAEYQGQASVRAEDFAGLREGQAIPVRVWAAAPADGHWPGLPGRRRLWPVGAMLLAAVFWNGCVVALVWLFYVRPYRHRWLVRHGVPTTGVVRELTAQERGTPESYKVRYEYAVPAGHRTPGGVFRGATTGRRAQGAADLKPGDLLTVLYDPRHPRRSVLYRFADYRAVGPTAGPPP